jgi:channel protein (hemolysin III family)
VTPISFIGFADPISSWTHLLAAFAAAIGTGFLMTRGRGNISRMISLGIFSFSLMFLFSMSGVFHLLERGGDARDVLQRLDHAGIWVLIAGTFTPIHVILFRGAWRWGVLLFVWIVAITALVLEVVFFNSIPEVAVLSFFLGLGWVGSLTGYLFRRLFRDPSIYFFGMGGIFYSIGAIIDFLRWPVIVPGWFGPHEIFHVFVVLGALSHWIFIYRWCHHPVVSTITFDVVIYPENHIVATALGDNIEVIATSIAEMKKRVRENVVLKYHSTMQPLIKLRYRREENI